MQRCEAWLRDGRPNGTEISVVESEPPPLNKGQTIADAVVMRRFRLREIVADMRRIKSAPYPLSEARQKIAAQIFQLAQRGEPFVDNVIEHLGDVIFQTQTQTAMVYNLPVPADGCAAITTVPDLMGLYAWQNRDALIASLCAKAAEVADDEHALGQAERAQREAEVLSDMLANERIECEMIWRAESEGQIIEFRGDCDVCALLGIELVAAAAASPVTPSFLQSFTLAIGSKG